MKKKRLLSTLAISAFVGVMTLGTTTPAYADSITNILFRSDDPHGDIWRYGYTEDDMIYTSNISMGRQDGAYTKWIGDNITDRVTLRDGGELITNHSNANGTLVAEEDSILTINSGILHLNSSSGITESVNLTINGTLDMQGGGVSIGSGDTWNGTVSMANGSLRLTGVTKNGTFRQSSGTTFIYQDLSLTSASNDSVSGGTLRIGNYNDSIRANLITNIDLGADVYKEIQTLSSLTVNGGTTVMESDDAWQGLVSVNKGGTVKYNSTYASPTIFGHLKLNGGTFSIANGIINELGFTDAINNAINSNIVLDVSLGDTNTSDIISANTSGAATIFVSNINLMSDNKNGGEVQIADRSIIGAITAADVLGGYADVQYDNSTGVLSFANKIDWLQQTNGVTSGYRFTKTDNGIMPVNYTSGDNNYTFYTDIFRKNYIDNNDVSHDLKYTWNNANHRLTVTNSDETAVAQTTMRTTGAGSTENPYVLTGDYTGNSSALGFARWDRVGSITGDFIGNTNGGIGLGMGITIGDIKGNFIGNSGGRAFSFSGDHSWSTNISSITGDFIGNTNGAIYLFNWNSGGIGTVTGDFIGNSDNGSGGAIWLADTHINSVVGNFVNNYAGNVGGALYVGDGKNGASITVTGDFIANQAGYKGGAIYTGSSANTTLIDTSFIGNIAPEGAAIYTNKGEMSITALNKDIEFTNNNSTGTAGGDGYGIYHTAGGYRPLAINAYEGKTITVNDKVYSEQKINLNCYYSGDWVAKNGTIIFNNEFNQTGATEISSNESNAGGGTVIFNGTTTFGDLDVSGTATVKLGTQAGNTTIGAVTFSRDPKLDIANGAAQTLTVASIKRNAKIAIDLDFTGENVIADAINITTGGQTGVLTIDSINALTSDTGVIRGFSDLAILTGETEGVTLALSDAIQSDERFFGDEVESITREVNNYTDNATFGQFDDNKFSDTVYAHKTQNRLYFNDAKTTLSFGVIEVVPEYVKSAIQQDVLQALNQSTSATRTLTATDTNKNYTVGADLGTTGAGSLTVQGVEGSNLNMNNKSGFELSNANTTLTLSDLNITNVKDTEGGLISITGENSKANLENITIAATTNSAISNNKTLNLSGTNNLGTGITGTGTTNITGGKTTIGSLIQNAVNISSGELAVANITTTEDISNAGTLTLTGGNLTNNVTGSGQTVIDGTNVSVAYGNTIEQDIVINSGKGLVNTNVSVIGGDVENNGNLQIYSKDNATLEHDITGTGTTELNRDMTIAANIDNAINIKSYTDAEGTHNANVIVESGHNFGKAGQNITVASGNNLTMQSANDIKGNLVNNGTVELQGGAILNAITGTGNTNISGDTEVSAAVSSNLIVADGKTLDVNPTSGNISSAVSVALGDGSKLDISGNTATGDTLNNISVASGKTANLAMDWGDKVGTNNIAGNLNVSDIDLTGTTIATPTTYTMATGSNLANVAIDENVNLKTNTTSFNQVKYNSTTGEFTGAKNNLAQAVNTTEAGESAIYAMSSDEPAGVGTAGILDGGKLVIQGNGQAVTGYGIIVGDGTHQADLTIKEADIKDLTSGNALELKKGTSANSSVTLISDTREMTINGDIVSDDKNNVVYFKSGTINFNGKFDPAMGVVGGATVNRGGDDDGIDWTVTSGTLKYLKDSYLNRATNTMDMNGGTLNTINGVVTDFALGGFTLSADSNFYADVDLANKKMDNFLNTPTTYTAGTLHVAGLNLISDSKTANTSIPFANSTLAGHVDYTGGQGLTALSPIYKYNVGYDNTTGNFNFARSGNGGYGDYNPAVLAAPVAAQLGGYLTQLNSYDEAFYNMDMYMLMTAQQRQALKNKNKIASIDGGVLYDATLLRQERAEGWFRPYVTFEKVGLKNGPKVSNTMYGSFMGGESQIYDLGHGWDGMWGAYVGYNGSHQNYNGISIYQNGGTLGVLGMAYKGNFFTGLTLNAGANGVEANTMYGNEDFAMLMAGIASKTGYNWELFNGKFIIQPSMLMSYSFVNTFDYHNGAGVKIDSDPLHAIQLQPEIKFIGNLKNGWQPYASVAMIWNIMDDTKFKANDVSLPELSVKPYVKYGVGIRKTWGERFTGFFQTYLTNGGRNGVGLRAGFTWAFGGGRNKKADEQKIQKSLKKTPELKKTSITLNGNKIQ